MLTSLRHTLTRLTLAAAAISTLGLAGFAGFSAHAASAAPAGPFKADISVTPAFQIPVNGNVFYYFKISNTGISAGTVKNPQYTCGVRYHFVGESTIHYTYQYGLYLPSAWVVNAGETRYLVAQCNAYSPEDTIVGVRLVGDLDNNIGPDSFSTTVGYVP